MKDATLTRIERDLAVGDHGKARDRLHGLIATYPDDLDLRRRLGDVYWQLQYPAMAGRYWYLEEEKSLDMVAACDAFERSCGHDPLQMLLALKFRGDIQTIRDRFAGRTLLGLQERAKEEHGLYLQFGKGGKKKYQYTSRYGFKGKWVLASCVTGALILLGLMVIGLVTVLRWMF